MKNMISASLAGLVGVITGSIISLYIQFRLRKEPFKEIFYEEKLAAYKELSQRLWKFYTTAIEILSNQSEFHKLPDEAANCLDFICGSGLVVSKTVNEKANKLLFETQRILFDIIFNKKAAHQGDLQVPDYISIQKTIGDYHLMAANAIRDDIHCDLIADEIYKTLNYGRIKSGPAIEAASMPDIK